MKLRLLAAVAPVGWCLISPIGEPAKPGVLPPNTPLSQWRNLGTFDSADQCQKALASLRASFEQDTQKEITVWRSQRDNSHQDRALHAAAAQAVAESSLCVASNDPRLKKTLSGHRLSSPPPTRGDSARRSDEIRNQKGQNLTIPPGLSRDAFESRRGEAAPAQVASTTSSADTALPTAVVALPSAGEPATTGHSQSRPPLQAAHSTELMKPVTIASSGNLTFWRLTPGGVIARSTDGVHWRPLSSGTTSDLVAGAAPSAEICWVVGRGGTVLRTTDGEQWQAIASPTDADLVSVAASDELSATVLASDGRQFTTNDGGLQWWPIGSDMNGPPVR